jgi:hypothetical protein
MRPKSGWRAWDKLRQMDGAVKGRGGRAGAWLPVHTGAWLPVHTGAWLPVHTGA